MAGRRVLLLAAALQLAAARFVIEEAGLKVVLPEDAAKKYKDGFETSLGNFGAPVYGGQLIGKLIYPHTDYGVDVQCNPPCNYVCQPFDETSPKLDLSNDAKEKTFIMMADRGPNDIPGVEPCKFAEKAWYAQKAGAKGIIVVNYEDKQTTMYAPEDDEESYKWLRNITIPAVFVTKSTGDALKSLLKDNDNKVYVSLDWNDVLPRKKTVEWEFWTNSNDMCGAVCDVQTEFIKEFRPIAQDLEKNNWTTFTPHYKIWRCPDSYRDSEECQKQCVHKGRYCSPDPETDAYEGKAVVQENLRQLCFFKLANQTGRPFLWWDYVSRFNEKCKMEDGKYGKECAEKVFVELGGDKWSSLDKFRECSGNEDEDRENPLLEAEYEAQVGSDSVGEVYILPTIRINHAQYRGKLAYYEVLRALCTGFNKDYEPEECNKVSENECLQGGPGYAECRDNKDGKTRCVNTFTGYLCSCGDGFYTHTNEHGKEECLDVNECWSAGTSLGHNCTCERCACRNTWGSYECITDLPNNCVEERSYGNCWHAKMKAHGKEHLFSACKDNLLEIKTKAANGDDVINMPVSSCECPPCFEGDGTSCKPKCSLDECDLQSGSCGVVYTGGGGFPGWATALTVLLSVSLVAGAGYFIYWFRLRSAMHQEIRAIMAQYMPLEAQGGAGPGPMASGGSTEMIGKSPNGNI